MLSSKEILLAFAIYSLVSISELVSESLFTSQKLTVIRTQETAMLQQETNNVNCGAHVNSRGFFCVYIYWINKNGSSLLYFSLLI